MNDKPDFWFPAKRYGWGWGPPVVWQGWAVLAVFVLALTAGAVWWLPKLQTTEFVLYSFALAAVLVLVCWLKGERPRWRWGGD